MVVWVYEGSRSGGFDRATDDCTVITKGMLHPPRAWPRARWTRGAVWRIPWACRPPGTEDPSCVFLPRVARSGRRRGWWVSTGKPFCGGGGMIRSSRGWLRRRSRWGKASELTECGSVIHSEECARLPVKVTAGALASAMAGGDFLNPILSVNRCLRR